MAEFDELDKAYADALVLVSRYRETLKRIAAHADEDACDGDCAVNMVQQAKNALAQQEGTDG